MNVSSYKHLICFDTIEATLQKLTFLLFVTRDILHQFLISIYEQIQVLAVYVGGNRGSANKKQQNSSLVSQIARPVSIFYDSFFFRSRC